MKNTTAVENAPAQVKQPEPRPKRSKGAGKWVLVAGVGLIGGWMWFSHAKKGTTEAEAGPRDDEQTPIVAVRPVGRETIAESLALSAEFRPYQEIRVHSKVAGYVDKISVDIGDHVKEGQTLAVLEIPELKNDVQRAEAALDASRQEVSRSEASYEEAHDAFERLSNVAKANPKLVAAQDLEASRAKDATSRSALEASRLHVVECQAEVDKMHTLLGYADITAPFDGVITKRYADNGALIQAGTSSNTQAMPLVELAQDDRLRLDFPVPESVVSKVHPGSEVEITVESLNQTFRAVVTRCSGKVDTSTRTMDAEVDIQNSDGKFTPGMYASVKVILDSRKDALAVPIQAVINGESTTKVMVVNAAQEIEERPVKLGLESPDKVEVLSGLKEGDRVIIGNRSALRAGEKVISKQTDLAAN
jgi:RND family efflux transporter MFP subunit